MSTRERNRPAAAGVIAAHIIATQGPQNSISHPTIYNVAHGTAPNWIQFSSISRVGVKFNTGHTGIGTNPIEVSFKYKTYGAPNGLVKVGVHMLTTPVYAFAIYGLGIKLHQGTRHLKTCELLLPTSKIGYHSNFLVTSFLYRHELKEPFFHQ